ncbi:MAG TPA: MFS transporter [Gemmataceae bacterium]|nr:MFS transporter [Gemmataceae bacterium]
MRSFAHRNFRLFFIGQGISLVGTLMQNTALPWLVLERTHSKEWLGWVAFVGQFPSVFAAPLAGVAADYFRKRNLLLITQALAMGQAFVLAVLTLTNQIQMWQILVLNSILAIVNGFDLTTRQSFLYEMVDDKEDLGNAIALNSSVFNTARLIGPAIAGLIIAAFGEGECFLLNAFSFLTVLIALWAMRVPVQRLSKGNGRVWRQLREGVEFALASFPIRSLFLLVALISFFGVPYIVLIPVYVQDALQADVRWNGWLLSAGGLGALTAGLLLASRHSIRGIVRGLPFAPVLTGLAFLGLSLVSERALAIPLVYLTGFSIVALLTSCNTTIQTLVDDDKRGRVIGLYAVLLLGLAPLGNLVACQFAAWFGIQRTLQTGGVVCLLGGAAFLVLLAQPLVQHIQEHFGPRKAGKNGAETLNAETALTVDTPAAE